MARMSALEEYPVDPEHLDRDVGLAQKAVVIHAPEQWPSGTYCTNCHDRHPCRLHRWGRQVLCLAGWRDAEVTALLRRAAAGDVPWP